MSSEWQAPAQASANAQAKSPVRGNPAGRFFDGLMVLPRGLGLCFGNRTFLILAAIPFFVASVLLVYGISWAASTLPQLIATALLWLSLTGMYFSVLYYVGLILAWPAFLLALLFILFLVVKIVASPFHSLLAEATLTRLGAIPERPFAFFPWLKTSLRLLLITLAEVVVLATVGFFLFLLSFIPLVNFFAAFGFFLLVAFDAADFSFEALHYGLSQRFQFFAKNFAAFSGVAFSMGLIFLVPGLNLLLFPAAVVGSAQLIAKIVKEER